ncbi:MAG: hypothetical protein HYX63_21570 [Gammaproteobacteria bacterium]|nr:hypothetical protein [Gammaproteobacteria bacterium]
MGAVANTLKVWQTRIDALSLKERALCLAATLLVCMMGWDKALIQPLDHERSRLQNELDSTGQALTESENLAADILAAATNDPNAAVRGALARTRAELATTSGEIKQKVGRMVTPEQMAAVLQSVLTRFKNLEFVGLEGLGAEPLVANSETKHDTPDSTTGSAQLAATAPAGQHSGAYRHGIRIRFAGSYLSVMEYLQALEALPWGFFWDRVELNTVKYPRVEGAVVVYTLSLDRDWIGI